MAGVWTYEAPRKASSQSESESKIFIDPGGKLLPSYDSKYVLNQRKDKRSNRTCTVYRYSKVSTFNPHLSVKCSRMQLNNQMEVDVISGV